MRISLYRILLGVSPVHNAQLYAFIELTLICSIISYYTITLNVVDFYDHSDEFDSDELGPDEDFMYLGSDLDDLPANGI